MALRLWTLCLVLLPLTARAGDEIQKAQLLAMQMKYVEALKLAEGVLGSSASSPEEVRGAYDIVAQCQASLGREPVAVEAFQRLLVLDPAYRLPPGISPKIEAPFTKALAGAAKLGALELGHTPPKPGATLAGVELGVAVQSNPLGLAQGVRLVYSAPGGAPQGVVRPLKGAGPVIFKLSSELDLPAIHYYFEAVGAGQASLKRLGGPDAPFKLAAQASPSLVRRPTGAAPVDEDPAAPPKDEDPEVAAGAWYTSWWFWTVVGVVVVGGAAAGLAVGLSDGDDPGLRYDLVIR